MGLKLYDSELKIMSILWKEGDTTAKRIAEIAKVEIGWSKTTTYTVIKKCIDKGAIKRLDPTFTCCALVTREQVQLFETNELIRNMYEGSADQLIVSLLHSKILSEQELAHIKEIVNRLE
ncbi:MAG TPA: BlaI/MecI/CopY family transcriptional regulator [Clostridiales bacterium]|nr:BlaI/MecI/CopY family transcriptional regulator [Clostridiales bacterium]